MERELGEQVDPVLLTKRIEVLSLTETDKVEAELSEIAEKWHEIGTVLRLSAIYLKKLKDEGKPAQENLHTVITEWLGGNCPCPTWEVIMKMLKDSKVGEEELADKLDNKYKIAETVADSGEKDGPLQPIGCGIKGCICDKFVEGLTDEIGYTFPNLELSEDYDKEKEEEIKKKIILEFHECLVDYDLFYSLTWRSIDRKKATPEDLMAWMRKNELFQTYGKVIYPRIPLFCHFERGFKASKTFANVFEVLRDHVDTFNHSVTVDILLNLGGSKWDKRMLDNFRDKYYGFMRRKATNMSRIYSHPSASDYFIVRFTLKRDITKIFLTEVDYFCTRLTFNLCISRFSMKLLALVREEEGLVTYIYQMPSYARNFVFPLTDEQIHSMRLEMITAIRCCSYNLIIPEEAPEGVESLYGVTRSFHSDDPKPPEEEVAMEVEGESSEPKIPLYALLPADSPFRMDSGKVPPHLEHLQDRCPGTDNYVAILPKASDKILYTAMVLCQHAADRKQKNQFVKCVLIANSKPRAHEIHDELKAALPKLNITMFTGTEENSMTIKLCLSQDIILVCTSGKFYSELESDVVKFSSVSLLVIDDCQYAMRQSLMEAVFHKYLSNRIYDSIKPPNPQILGVTCNPGECATALDEEGMQRHLLRVAGGVDSNLGLVFTEEVLSDTYTPPNCDKSQPKPKMRVEKVKVRDPKRDAMVRIHVAILYWERSISLGTPHNKWTTKYNAFIKSELESSLAVLDDEGQDAATSLKERVGVLELLQCFSEAIKACVEFGTDSALAILQAPTLDSAMSTTRSLLTPAQFDSLLTVTKEVEALLAQRNPVVEAIENVICKQFTTNRDVKSRGILFVDSFKDAQFICSEIAKSHFFSRPVVVPRYLVAQYSLDTCSEVEREEQATEEALEKGRDGLKAFARGDSRLMIIPYALEKDDVKIENIESEFDFVARLHRHIYRDDAVEAEYILNFMLSPVNKPFAELQSDFDMCRTELGLHTLPTGQALKKKLKKAMEDVMHGYQSRFIFPLTRSLKTKKNEPNMEKIQLRCKKCKVLACHGMEIYCFFVDGGRHCVVPHRDFSSMYQTQPYLAKHKAIKRVNRLRRMFCCNCGAPWGVICHFPAKGCQLPVLKFKHFVFEMNHKYYYIKMLDDALFKLPPITASAIFRIHGPADMEMD